MTPNHFDTHKQLLAEDISQLHHPIKPILDKAKNTSSRMAGNVGAK